jgi:hypothetical protein
MSLNKAHSQWLRDDAFSRIPPPVGRPALRQRRPASLQRERGRGRGRGFGSAGGHAPLKRGRADWQATHRYFGRDVFWEGAPVERLPDQREMLGFIDHVETHALDWLRSKGDEDLLAGQDECRWTGPNLLSRCIYAVRHAQHHIGELNAELRRRGLRRIAWAVEPTVARYGERGNSPGQNGRAI